MSNAVDIRFDCLPLRSIGRLDVPEDASPKFREKCERIAAHLARYGTHNSYYLHNARCVFQLTNNAALGMLEFRFEGTLLTDSSDEATSAAHIDVELVRETCEWLTEPAVQWFHESVRRAVMAEFDRYIAAGDLEQTLARMSKLQAASDAQGGYLGMYL
ncbi:MAG: hypothetical protein K1X74_13820 [Pirellulales bacterium]|nr:hypothetical protein [Pirellulales bacterium]